MRNKSKILNVQMFKTAGAVSSAIERSEGQNALSFLIFEFLSFDIVSDLRLTP